MSNPANWRLFGAGHHSTQKLRPLLQECTAKLRAIRKLYPFDTIVGCGLGSVPWASVVAYRMRLPFLAVRKPGEESFASGPTELLAGHAGVHGRCVFLDDLKSAGRTLRRVCDALAKEDLGVVAHLTRSKGWSSRQGVKDQHTGVPHYWLSENYGYIA